MLKRALVAYLALVATVCAVRSASAQEVAADFAVVVMVTDKEIVFDRGTRGGVAKGDKVRLYRTLTIHHPVTGREIEDRFPIAVLRVAESSELLSIIKNSGKLPHQPEMGDLVELIGEVKQEPKPAGKPTAEPSAPAAAPKPAPSAASGEQRALGAAFIKSLGRPIAERILIYSRFLSQFAEGSYAQAVGREIEWLEDLEDRLERGAPTAGAACVEKTPARPVVLHPVVGPLEVDDEAQVVIAVLPPELVAGARLYLRRVSDEGYDEIGMVRDGAYYYRAHIPGKYVSRDGQLAYFVETAGPNGEVLAVIGSEARPKQVSITTPIVDRIVREDRSTTRATFEYVNFDMDDKVDDEYWSFEADFFYRIRTFLYGVRVGMGIFSGTGGRLNAIEESRQNNQQLAAHYGFLEGEFEIVPLFHFMVRGLAGNQRSPGEDHSTMSGVFGVEGGIRIGEEVKTNLALSGAILEDVGYEGRLALAINVFAKVPITVEGLVTNFPVEESHVGLRLVVGLGYRFTDWLAIFARGSWNARTIKHTGFGGGASMALFW